MGTSSIATTGRGFFGGRPRGRLLTTIRPFSISSPPQTPQGSARSIAASTQTGASEHLLQIAFARAMSSGVSEKKRWVRVPWPSAQRGRGARTATGSTSSANSVSMSRLMSIAYISGGSSRTSGEGEAEKAERPPGSDPDGLGAVAPYVVLSTLVAFRGVGRGA